MEEIILRQHNAAKPLTGRTFVLNVAGILLKLAIAQIVVNLLISLTGIGLLNLLFYLYSVLLLVAFMRRSVASCVYTLKENTMILEKKMGDSTFSVVEIPLDRVISVRPFRRGDRIKTAYTQVTVIDPETRPELCVRLGFLMSLLSVKWAWLVSRKPVDEDVGFREKSKTEKRIPWLKIICNAMFFGLEVLLWHAGLFNPFGWILLILWLAPLGFKLLYYLLNLLAKRFPGRPLNEEIGYVLVYLEGRKRCACTFLPDEKMREALKARLGVAYGFDDRMTRAHVGTLYARALQRAFPALYPYVHPLLNPQKVEQAKEEIAARKEAKEAKKEAEKADKKAGGKREKKLGGTQEEKPVKKQEAPAAQKKAPVQKSGKQR